MSDYKVVLPMTTEEWQRDMRIAYNQAIDDFREKIMDINLTKSFERYTKGIYDLEELMIEGSREMAEQLKGEKNDD